jgi:hypothetical protein
MAILYTICLFVSYVQYKFLFFTALIVLLCFHYMHFQWCGFVYACALIDVDQRVRDEDKNKSYFGAMYLLFHLQQFVGR